MAIAFETKVEHPFFGAYASPFLPDGTAEGDLIIAFLHAVSQPWTLPVGWTLIHESIDSATMVAYRVAGAMETDPEFTLPTDTYGNVILLRYSGVDTENPIAADEAIASASNDSPSITTVSDGNQIVHWLAADGNMGVIMTPPSGDTQRASVTGGYDMYLMAWIADQNQASAGATGTATWTPDLMLSGQRSGTFALVPPGAGGGGGGEGGESASALSGLSGISGTSC